MSKQKKLTKSIVTATEEIQAKFPELTKYIDEIPVHDFSDITCRVNKNDLKEYLDSLKDIAKSYGKDRSV